MKLLKKVVPSNFNLFLFGDVHTGTIMHHKKGFDKLVDMILSPYAGLQSKYNYAIDHGDIIEGIMVDDPRFRPEEGISSPMLQLLEAIEIRQPIRDNLVTILEGNHPLKLWRFGPLTQFACGKGEIPFTQKFKSGSAYGLGVDYGTWTAKVSWVDKKGRLIFKSWHTHGRKTITSVADDPVRQVANWKLSLKKQLKEKAGDCLLMCKGHTHKLLICTPEPRLYLTDNGRETKQNYTEANPTDSYIHPDLRWYVNTGSFLKLFDQDGVSGYAEMAEYDPIELGFPVAKIRNRKIDGIDKVVL